MEATAGQKHLLPVRAQALVLMVTGLAASGLPLMAQDVRLEAEVDRYVLTTDDVLYLSVSLSLAGNARVQDPQLEPNSDFTVLGSPERQMSYNIINGQVSRSIQLVYALQPRRTGKLTVPVAKVIAQGKLMTTRPITVQVTQGTGGGITSSGPAPAPPPAPAASGAPFEGTPDFIIICRTDRKEAYVNQQITVEIDYYTTYRLPRAPGQEAPRAEGFIAEKLPDAQPDYVTVNGEQYARLTCRWALFATSPGKHTITSAPEELMLPPLYSSRKFQSNTVTVNIRPLPPAPPGSEFSGAVGLFSLQLAADKTQVKAGEGLTVRAIVDGTGNLQTVRAPKLTVPQWCKVYPSGEKRNMEPRPSGGQYALGGRAEFEYLVVPRRAGRLEIPPASLVYFRPDTGNYATATSDPLVLEVTPGEVIQEPSQESAELAIRHIHTDRPRVFARAPLTSSPVFAGLVGVCALALAVTAGVRLRRDRQLADPRRARALGAARAARRGLRRAAQSPNEQVCAVVGEVLYRYLADRLDLPVTGLSAQEVHAELLARGLSAPTADQARTLLERCNAAKFAPGAGDPDAREVLSQAEALIVAVEREGGRPGG